MAISERRMKNAVKKYNNLMYKYGLDHLAIHEENANWTLRDMISEICYQHETATTSGFARKDEYDEACEDYATYKDDGSKLGQKRYKEAVSIIESYREMLEDFRKFAMQYRKEASQMKCVERHSSKWD